MPPAKPPTTPSDTARADRPPTPSLVVGLGIPAGGAEALEQLLQVLPERSGMAFIAIPHADRDHRVPGVEGLSRHTRLRVVQGQEGALIEADTVHVIEPGTLMGFKHGRFLVHRPTEDRGLHSPVDHLFGSLAHELGPRAVGIMLSGVGRQGLMGLRAIKAAGGLALAEKPLDAAEPDMAHSAIDAGVVDAALPIAELPGLLERFARLTLASGSATRDDNGSAPGVAEELPGNAGAAVAALLKAHHDFDMERYQAGVVTRRVMRRMSLTGLDRVDGYLKLLGDSEAERQTLMRDLLIEAAEFFRDPDAYQALATTAIAELVAGARPNQVIRVWIAGCATGEAAYSVVMLLLEAIAARDKSLGVQVFATDMDDTALEVARAGMYPSSIASSVSAERLERFFTVLSGGGFRVRPRLRDAITFAAHDLFRDPPFSRMDLIACRDVLVHADLDTQGRLLGALHFALKPAGYLFLGPSESIEAQPTLFTPVSAAWRIYQRTGNPRPMSLAHPAVPVAPVAPPRPQDRSPDATLPPPTIAVMAMEPVVEALLNSRVPPSVVVAGDNRILYAHGELNPYLRYPRGQARLDIIPALRDDLAVRVRAALYRCRRDNSTIKVLSSGLAGDGPQIEITASPAAIERGAVVLSFEPAAASAEAPAPVPHPEEDGRLERLERELGAHREDLRYTLEELDATNEELRASNEESMSMNEELRAANEELEATSEELRSLNDELFTVNAQLKDKVEQLEEAHNDLSNFFASTQLATLFLDESLRIKRFTPATAMMLGLRAADLGRDMRDLACELLRMNLAQDASAVLEDMSPRSSEIQAETGRWFIRRLLPYRTEAQRVEGVVVTWIDVTELKQTSARLAVRERQQAVIATLGMRALEADDLDGFMDELVAEVARALDTGFCKVLELQHGGQEFLLKAGVGWNQGLVGNAVVSTQLDSQAGYTLVVNEAVVVEEMAAETRFTGPALLHDHGVISGISCVIKDGDEPYGVLGAHTRTRRVFTEDDTNFLQAVANVLASAIGRKKSRQRLAVDHGVARVLSESRSLEDAVPRIFQVFARELGVSVCELWTPLPDGEALQCTAFATPDEPHRSEELRRLFDDRIFARGLGLVGRVWQERRAEWLTRLDDEREFVRADMAQKFGLICGFGFPIVTGQQVGGVITLLSRQRLIPDRAFFAGLEATGTAIGEFVRHTEAVNATRVSEERFRLAVEAAGALVYETTYPDSIIVSLLGAERLLGETTTTPAPVSWWFDRIHPDDVAHIVEQTERTTRGDEDIWTLEYRMRHRDGHYVEVEGHGRIVRENHGSPRRIGVVLDVSERKRSAAILADRERRLRLAIGALEAGVFEHAVPASDDLYLSERWIEILGYRSEDLPPSERFEDWFHRDIVHPDDRPRFERAYNDFITGKTAKLDIDVRMRHRRGHWIWGRSVADAAERDRHGQVTRLTGLLWDITEAREAERRLQRTFETSHLGIVFARGDCRITRCNDAVLAMLGYSREDFESGDFDLRALSPPEFEGHDRQAIADLVATGRLEPVEKELMRKGGSRITVLFSATTLGFADEFVAFLVDLTRQKRTEAELSKLASIVESSDDAILSKDIHGTILSWNRGAERLYGYTAEEAVGQPVGIIIPPDKIGEFDDVLARLARGEHIESHETVRRRKDGSRVDVSVTISPVIDKWGNITGASAVARDITERKRAEEALHEADRQKNQFLAMLGHELRNPLAAIRNASELLKLIKTQDSNLDRTRSVLDRQTAHMAKLIDGLLDVSRMVRGKIVLDTEVVDLVQILGHVLQDHAGQIESRGLVLRTDIPAEPIWISGDRVRLAQIFDNLLSNAIKFTQRTGSITVRAWREGDTAVIAMHDSGMGIEPELLPHIFEPFRQAVQSLDRSAGGLGLGLALVKGVVQLHGGEVEARSEGVDQGAEFIVRLPVTAAPVQQPAPQAQATQALRLLVVEDHEDAAELLRELLTASSHEVAVAYSAPRAMTIARAFKPDVILCDIGLPDGISGYDLARTIRDDDSLRGAFLVALTGYGHPDDRRKAEDAGFDAHLTKPVSLAMIQDVLARARK